MSHMEAEQSDLILIFKDLMFLFFILDLPENSC